MGRKRLGRRIRLPRRCYHVARGNLRDTRRARRRHANAAAPANSRDSLRRVSDALEDWAAHVEGLAAGDQLAFLKLSRLVTGFLAQLRAYDFRDEWPDLIQEVMLALITASRDGKIRDHRVFPAFVRIRPHRGKESILISMYY